VTVRRGERIERRVDAPDELNGPLPRGRRVGSVTVLVDGRRAGRVPLLTAERVQGAGPLRIVMSVLGLPLTLLALAGILLAGALTGRRLRSGGGGARHATRSR
jgi:hypothetical protein